MATHKAIPLRGQGSDVSYEVIGSPTKPTAFKKENTIWINTDISIEEYKFAYNDPYTVIREVPCTIGEATRKMNSSGALASDVAWAVTIYYPVSSDAQYYLTYSESGACSAYYDANYTFISAFNVTKNAWTKLPSIPSNAKYVRFCIRTYTDTDDTQNFKYKYSENIADTGDVWIQIDADNATVTFNAIEDNELLVHPFKVTQWNGTALKPKEAWLLSNNNDILICKEITYLSGGHETIDHLWNVADGGTGGNTYGYTSDKKCLYTIWGGAGSVWINAVTKQAYDMTGISKVSWTLTGVSGCTTYFQIRKEDGSYLYNSALGNGTYSYDISAYNAPVYFRLATYFSFPNNGTDQNGDGKVDWYTGYSTLSLLTFE